MTEAMPFLQKCDITFLRPPPIDRGFFLKFSCICMFFTMERKQQNFLLEIL